jgi:nucleoside-triphosphatase THEP1
MKQELNEKWIKASIAGTIWAASEIVLGSFLHNLKIPFSGNILTAIGLIILISVSYIWTEKGLFWRAGIICALMKTMSPSAVIFGPMIAIFAESLILEFFVRVSGRTLAGYIAGSMVAMSWNLIQKILNYIIFYGSNIIDVYTDLLKLAQKQLDIKTDIVWLPIVILLIVYALFGLLAGIIGIRVGRQMLKQPASETSFRQNDVIRESIPKNTPEFNYSIVWLIIDFALVIVSFILLNKTLWMVWGPSIAIIVVVWSVRYKRALRQLAKPKFWILFVLITLLTAFVITRAQTGDNLLQKGLLTGIQMNFRAMVIIVGFAVLGTELYNPVIRNFFLRTSFKNLPLALELSAESLPAFISSIPDFKSLIKNPVSIFYHVLSQADVRLNEIRQMKRDLKKVFIISGSVGEGKTTYARNLVEIFRQNNIAAGGIISDRVMKDSVTTGYDIVDVLTGKRHIFLRQDEECGKEKIGKFNISADGLAAGISALNSPGLTDCQIIVIDEVGLLELNGNGWAEMVEDLLNNKDHHILLTVRDIYIDPVVKKWDIQDPVIIKIKEVSLDSAASIILGKQV